MNTPQSTSVLALLLAACVAAPLPATEPASYRNANLLIEAEQLKAALDEYVLIDVRSLDQHNRGTIHNAHRIDAREWGAAFGRGDDGQGWTRRLRALGAPGPKATFVVFDNAVTPTVCRTWWMLKYWGVEDVRVLNGGIKAWLAAGGALALPTKRKVEAGKRELQPVATRLITADRVKKIVLDRRRNGRLIDARTEREFTAGAIPTATNLDWQRLVEPATGKLRPAAELQSLLDQRGVDLREPIITYCRSGKRSSVLAFTLELMGAEQVANYYGSWNEWSRLPDAPIARPIAGATR